MISIGRFFAIIGSSIFLSILSFLILTEGMRPAFGGTDPLNYTLVFSARVAFVLLNILIIAIAAMKISIPESDKKQKE